MALRCQTTDTTGPDTLVTGRASKVRRNRVTNVFTIIYKDHRPGIKVPGR